MALLLQCAKKWETAFDPQADEMTAKRCTDPPACCHELKSGPGSAGSNSALLAPFLSISVLFALCVTGLSLIRAWPDTIDDAHITFRCLENWLAGLGLTFNPGMPPVEGFSNPLFLFTLAPLARIGIRPETGALALGLFSFGFCALAASGLVRALGGTARGSTLAIIGVLCHFPLLYYSVTGLETGFFAALVTAALWRYITAKGKVDGLGAVLWVLVALTRPEGILYPALLGCAELAAAIVNSRQKAGNPLHATEFRDRIKNWSSVLWLLGVAFVFGLFLIGRHAYFGAWLPNTYLAKPPGSADLATENNPLIESTKYILGFAGQLGILLPLGAIVGLRHRGGRSCRALWLVILGGVVFVFYAGGDWMPLSRFLLPTAVPWIALGARGIDDLITTLGSPVFVPNIGKIVYWTAAFSTFIAPVLLLADSYIRWNYYPFHVMNSSTCRIAAEQLRREFGPDHKIVAYRIGALGRYSGMTVVDLLGLVDRDIATALAHRPSYHPGKDLGDDLPEMKAIVEKYQPDLVLALQPPAFLPEAVTLYDRKYRLRRSYVLGLDQVWRLYRRED